MSVAPDSPAAHAGLRAGNQDTNVLLGADNFGSPTYLQSGGDLITAINGHPIAKMDDLLIYLEESASPGQTMQFTVLRNGRLLTISVTLGQRPSQAPG